MSILTNRSEMLKYTLSSSPTNQSPLKHNFSKFTMYDITQKNTKPYSNKNKSIHKRNHSLKGILNLNPQNQQANLQNQKNIQRKLSTMTSNISGKQHEKQTNLPFIHVKSKPFKRGSFLQLWLDQALDPQDLNKKASENNEMQQQNLHEQAKKVQTGKLKTMRKFQLDKQYLRSQNIPLDVIERLYNSLYIYTHGVNSIFTQLLGIASNDQNGDTKIVNIFWRAFVKLLQGCTSFQSSFQIIQQRHLRNVNQLKDLIQRRHTEAQRQKCLLQQTIAKLQKQIIVNQTNHSKLQIDFKVNQATLQMTDQAFNEEVQLRLKFQQKVNHIYTSYEELKFKYESLMQQVHIKMQTQRQVGTNMAQLEEKLKLYLAKNQQLTHQLELEKLRIKDRDQQIAIKKQQIDELTVDKQIRKQKMQQEEQMTQQSIGKHSMTKFKLQEANNRVSLLQELSKQQEKRIREQDISLQNYRKASQELHQKYNNLGKEVSKYQESKIFQTYQITRLRHQLGEFALNIQHLTKSNIQLNQQNQSDARKIGDLQFELDSKKAALQKNTQGIAQLKAVKDKHQRLFTILLKEKQLLEKQRNSISQKYQLQQEQVVGLRMLIESKDQSIREIQKKNDKQRQILKRKITGYNDAITKKQTSILSMSTKLQQSQKAKQTLKYRVDLLGKQVSDLQLSVKKLKNQNQYLTQNIEKQLKQKKFLNQRLKQLYQKNEKGHFDLSITQQKLGEKTSVVESKNQQINLEVENVKKVYEQYKMLIKRTAMYIHPMHFEDLKHRLMRCQQTIQKLKIKMQIMDEKIHNLSDQIEIKKIENNQKQDKINILQENISGKQKQIQKITSQKAYLAKKQKQKDQKIKSYLEQIQRMKSVIKSFKQTVQKVTYEKEQLQNTTSKLKRQITCKQIQIQKNINLINTLSNKVTVLSQQIQSRQKNSPLKQQIKLLESEVQTLKQEISQLNDKPQSNDAQIQTQKPLQFERFATQKFDHKKKFALQTGQKAYQQRQVQTQGKIHMYQTVPQYIEGKISQIKSLKQQGTGRLNVHKNQGRPQGIQGSPDAYYNQMKKVQTKDYKRALKLTYMRR